MSAYALPGFFPPIYGFSTKTESSNSSDSDTCSTSVSSPATRTSGPLHEQQSDSSRGITDILKASVDRFCPPLLSGSSSDEKKNTTKGDNEETCPGIAVKEGKIDPVRLVQCVTGASRTQQHQQQQRKLRRRSSAERSDSTQHSTQSRNKLVQYPSEEKKTSNTPHDEAIDFELSISFNGRKYNATRTMQCIVQLRDDLIREMNYRKQWLQIRRASEQPFHSDHSPNVTADAEDDSLNIQIPEIPPMTGDTATPGVGFVGRGFTMLHAMVTSYVPVMERWLRNVVVIVPQDSECLTNFLWEPLSSEMPLDFTPLDFSSKSCTSLATLGSIKELDYNTDDDSSDEEDEWEG